MTLRELYFKCNHNYTGVSISSLSNSIELIVPCKLCCTQNVLLMRFAHVRIHIDCNSTEIKSKIYNCVNYNIKIFHITSQNL